MRAKPRQMIIGPVILRATKILAAAGGLLALLWLPSAQAFSGIENTGPGADTVSGFGHVSAGPALHGPLLGFPFEPQAERNALAMARLGSPETPESDLAGTLAAIEDASSAAQADGARQLALDILEGNDSPALAKKAYRGIGLLNWKVKVQDVAANGTATIRQVRWGEHVISDSWLLNFADPSLPYSIRYEVVELGSAIGGELQPTPLLRHADGARIGGQHSAIQPLAIDGNRDMGTTQSSRFTIARGIGEVPEQTRSAAQAITVAMPPANVTSAILDPNVRPGHEAVATLKPATAQQITAARSAMGFDSTATDEQNKLTAIGRLSDQSPEKQIWSQLRGLGSAPDATANPAAADAYLAAAKTAGGSNRELVGGMRARSELPAGVDSAGADVTVVLQNNEAYVSRTALRLQPGVSLTVRVVNRDQMTHELSALDLHDRRRILGATDWGEFDWNDLDLKLSPTLGPGEARTFTLDVAAKAFALWIGDLASGDQSGAAIAIDREIKQEAVGFGASTVPIHATPAANGDIWVTLFGVDTIARIRPAAGLGNSQIDRFPLPGGKHEVDSAVPPLGPSDVAVDGRGIVWVTLSSGNAIARIDPAQAQNGTGDAIRILKLDPCPESAPRCQPEVPPVPNEQPTRRPTRIKSYIDGQGDTVLWFTEAGASRIGVMRVSESGSELAQAHFECSCLAPESLDLGADGSAWFAEIFENRIGRVIPDRTTPYTASAATVQHFNIPTAVPVEQPPLTEPVNTSLPLSVAVDGRNRVWFSQSALGGAAVLDPAQAVPGTSNGFTEFPLPGSDFRSPAAPADVMVDRGNNFWWVGEYGDQIEQLKPDRTQGMRFRGSARRGLTEGPIADAQGNLWVVESAGNLITRISGVTEGPLRPFGLPAGYEADTTGDSVSGVRLRDAGSVRVRVVRDGAIAASATVPVSDGAFEVSGADWQGAGADRVRPDDVVRILPQGSFERAELSFAVAKLSGAVRPDGSLAGTALAGTQALADRIFVTANGVTRSAPINGGDGAWRIVPATALAQDTALTLAWSGATVAGTFRTLTRVAAPAQAPPGTSEPPAGGSAPAADQNGEPAGAAPTGTQPGTQPGPLPATPPTTTITPPLPVTPAAESPCKSRRWLHGEAGRPRVLLLGMTRAEVVACIGRPTAKQAPRGKRLERWIYGTDLRLHLRAGRVHDYELRSGRFRTSRRQVGVGGSLSALRSELPGLRRDPRSGLQRALVRHHDGRFADIRVRLDKRGRIRQIGITLRKRSAMDSFGRSLLRSPKAGSR